MCVESSFLGKDQSWTEIGTDREQEWMLQEEVSDLQLSRLLSAPQNTRSNSDEDLLWGKDTSLLCLGYCPQMLFAVLGTQV